MGLGHLWRPRNFQTISIANDLKDFPQTAVWQFCHDKILPEFFATPPQLTVSIAYNQFPALRNATGIPHPRHSIDMSRRRVPRGTANKIDYPEG